MEELIDKTFQLIGDYRKHEDGEMTKDIIREWINQFDEEDRQFILTELNHIFATRYVTREVFKNYLRTTFISDLAKDMAEKLKITDIQKILKGTYLINHQPEGKSQKVIIGVFKEILEEDYGIDINDCGKNEIFCYLYLDDILCTGDTVFKGLTEFLDKTTLDGTTKNKIVIEKNHFPVVACFYAAHLSSLSNIVFRLNKYYDEKRTFEFWGYIEKDSMIDNNYKNSGDSKLSFIFPKREPYNELIEECKEKIEAKVDEYCESRGWKKPLGHFFRASDAPKNEHLFTSAANRDRFERIVLLKSIEIFNKASSDSVRMRPLGNGLTTEKSFGFGTLFFTWRNVPFNTPLVFWYQHGWSPLFKRNFSTYEKSFEDILKELFG